MTANGRKYRIVPKRDFGSGKGFYDRGRWIKKGFVVTDGFCNVMPGATWFETIPDAMRAIRVHLVTSNSNEFWDAFRGRP